MQIKFLEVRAHGLSRETFAQMGMTASDPLSLVSSQDSWQSLQPLKQMPLALLRQHTALQQDGREGVYVAFSAPHP